MPALTTVAEIGEFGLLARLRPRLSSGPAVRLGAGDDAAVVAVDGQDVVVTTDVLIQNRHFRTEWSSAQEIGRKAAAQNLADLAAMGATPIAMTVALAMPADTAVDWVLELADGLVAEAAEVGASVVGGDLTGADQIMIAITALGRAETLVTRSGARAGDVVAVCGRLGWAAAGLAVLGRGFRSPRIVVDAHRRPTPPYAAGPAAGRAGATAMIDVSDGLLADLAHIAEQSGVRIVVNQELLPIDAQIRETASAFNADPLTWVVAGGDDHALAATFPAGSVLPDGFRVIGEVTEGDPGVEVPGYRHVGATGYDHFRE